MIEPRRPAEPGAPAQDWRSSWIFITLLFAFASLVESLGFGHFGAFTPLYLQQLGVDASGVPRWTGYLASASFVLGLPLAPFWGIWADKYSRKMIIVRSAFGEALIFLVAAVSANVWQLLVARLLVGLILGNTGVMYAVISTAAPKRSLASAIAMVSLGNTVGMSVGPLLGGFFVTRWGISALLGVDSALSFLVGLLLVVGLREVTQGQRDTRPVFQMLVSLGKTVRGMPAVLALFAIYGGALLGAQLSMPFVPILVQRIYSGVDLPAVIGLVVSAFAVTSALFTPIWGRLGDRKGHLTMLALAVGGLVPVLGVQAMVASLPELIVARLLQGAFQAAVAPLIIALVAFHTPEDKRASILNLSLFPTYFAYIFGASLGAVLVNWGIGLVFISGGLVTAVAFGVLLRFTPGSVYGRKEQQ
ncbi:MAG: MFS transporter [Chloroflexi bacterium]|nr:MFS transporter [Chloroflexota bacterium]